MKVRRNLFPLCLTGIAATFAGCNQQAHSQKPNVILILADDMGYSDIGCFGSEIHTPNLDRLARQGVRMTSFYNASRSCPTRASLLTGLYQHQTGIGDMVKTLGYPSYQGFLNNQCVTIAEVLKLNGYNTYMSGKWHVGSGPENLPRKRGFDRYFGLIDGAGSYFSRVAYRANQPAPRWMIDDKDFTPPDSGFYLTDVIGDHAVSFLDEGSGNKEPFFLYLAFTAPHWPLHALPEDIARYRGKYLKGWDTLRAERYRRMLKEGILDSSVLLSPRDERSPSWDTLTEEQKKMWDLRMAVYAAMIERMDQNIGKVLDQLEKMNESDNTLIIFLSDNGGCHEVMETQKKVTGLYGETGTPGSFDSYEIPWANVSNTPFRMFKHWVHEGGISTPFIAYYPVKLSKGVISGQTGHITDIMPTLIEISGGKYPSEYKDRNILPLEGISLMPALTGNELKRDNPIFWEHEGNRAMRDVDWKIVSLYDNNAKKFKAWELYNMKNDRSELNDLSSKYPEKITRMINVYETWAARTGVVSRETLDKKNKN